MEVAAPAELFPDLTLAGNYLFLAAYLLYATVFNVLGEELYYRGVLLPRMRGVFGRWAWVANGLLFTLKHVYQRWTWGSGVFASLAFALLGGRAGSLWLAMLLHWVGNYLPGLIAGVPLVFGGLRSVPPRWPCGRGGRRPDAAPASRNVGPPLTAAGTVVLSGGERGWSVDRRLTGRRLPGRRAPSRSAVAPTGGPLAARRSRAGPVALPRRSIGHPSPRAGCR